MDALYQRYAAGATLRDLASETGLSVQGIANQLRRAGYPLRRRGQRGLSPIAHPRDQFIVGDCTTCGAALYANADEGWTICLACGFESWE